MFTIDTRLGLLEKLVCGLAIVTGILTPMALMGMTIMSGLDFDSLSMFGITLLGACSYVGGYCVLTGRPWGYWLVVAGWLPQSAEYMSHTFAFSLVGPFSARFGWTWQDPYSAVNINLVAICMCLLAVCCAASPSVRARAVPSVRPA